ncbi:aquaporin, partial [Candidatus Peregrinibacteria bacterium]|nr:aquaporin [Candidatus Peregrinibacteria bacterium]
ASFVTAYIFGEITVLGMGADGLWIVLGEAAGAFLLVLGITAVVDGRVQSEASGLTIGSSLLLGILVAAHFSAGILNPAVAVGLGSISLSYLIGPVIGGIAAAQLSMLWKKKK